MFCHIGGKKLKFSFKDKYIKWSDILVNIGMIILPFFYDLNFFIILFLELVILGYIINDYVKKMKVWRTKYIVEDNKIKIISSNTEIEFLISYINKIVETEIEEFHSFRGKIIDDYRGEIFLKNDIAIRVYQEIKNSKNETLIQYLNTDYNIDIIAEYKAKKIWYLIEIIVAVIIFILYLH